MNLDSRADSLPSPQEAMSSEAMSSLTNLIRRPLVSFCGNRPTSRPEFSRSSRTGSERDWIKV